MDFTLLISEFSLSHLSKQHGKKLLKAFDLDRIQF